MQLTEVNYAEAKPVDGYGPGFFRIGGKVHEGTIVVTADSVIDWGGYEDAETLLALQKAVDVIFVGTGEVISHIPAELRRAIEDAGMGVEIMATPAACRTYNVLLSEGRRVALALIPV